MQPSAHPTPDRFLAQIFDDGPSGDDRIVKRRVREVEEIVGRHDFVAALRSRGYRAVQNGGEFVIFCNHDPVVIVR